MLGTPKDPKTPPTKSATLKPRDRAIQLRVHLPAQSEASGRRLARRIQESLARTLSREPGAALDYTLVGGGGAPHTEVEALGQQRNHNKPRHAKPGCGAWWNF